MKKQLYILAFFIFLFPEYNFGQDHPSQLQNHVLDAYIQEGLQSNESLRQLQLDYSMNLAALKQAKGLFFPDLSVNARYTVANGGRVIEFPVGDMLNPVYNTLNLLTMSEQFPEIENMEFNFYRSKEHETKLRLIQPIFQSALISNYQIRKQGVEISQISIEQYKNELTKEISIAYYNYQKAAQLVMLSDTTMALVNENLRASKSLFANDKVTIDIVYRSEAELSKVKAEQAKAVNLLKSSKAFFNFLLNKELNSDIQLSQQELIHPLLSLNDASKSAIENRNEIKQIEAYRLLNQKQTQLYKGANLPGVYGVVDYGFQGAEYKFTNENDFVLASLVLEWQLFKGNTNRQKIQQSKIEGEKLRSIQDQTKQHIELEVINYYFALQAAIESVEAANSQLRSTSKAYQIVERKFKEGQCNLLELIDARTSMTGAATNLIISRSDYFSNLANFNYATGTNYTE